MLIKIEIDVENRIKQYKKIQTILLGKQRNT